MYALSGLASAEALPAVPIVSPPEHIEIKAENSEALGFEFYTNTGPKCENGTYFEILFPAKFKDGAFGLNSIELFEGDRSEGVYYLYSKPMGNKYLADFCISSKHIESSVFTVFYKESRAYLKIKGLSKFVSE